MDPTENLRQQRSIAMSIRAAEDSGLDIDDSKYSRLAELVIALDDWIAKGGFLPEQWKATSGFRR